MTEALERQLKTLIAKKETLFLRVQTLFDLTKSIDQKVSRDRFEVLYETINTTRSDFEEIIDQINDVSLKIKPEGKPSYDVLNSFNELFCSVQVTAKKLAAEKRSCTSDMANTEPNKPIPRLPKLSIPVFDGDMKSWTTFYECFKSLIHENKDLTDLDRVHYLMGSLVGSARASFSGLPPTGENYAIIWNGLVEKYQDNRKLATSYLDTILGFKTLQSESASNLNLFLESFDPAVSAIKKLEIDNLFDFFLAHVALGKLDMESRRVFEMLRNSNGNIPTYEEVVDFVKSRARVLTSSESCKNDKFSSKFPSSGGGSHKPKLTHSFLVNNSEGSKKCRICSRDVHFVSRCPKFLKLTPKERYEIVKRNGLCLNCLSYHRVIDCKSKFGCTNCHRRHHSLLHFENAAVKPIDCTLELPERSANTLPNYSPLCSTASFHSLDQSSMVLLSTVAVNFIDNDGNLHLVRFLLDSASQGNFLTSKCSRRLKLPVSRFHTTVLGLGSNASSVLGKTNLVIASRFDSSKKFVVDALVVEKICDRLPAPPASLRSYPHLANIPLADELFNQSMEIDGILGAEIFPYVIGRNKISGPLGAPVAIETDFGYVIMGRIPVNLVSKLENRNIFCSFFEPTLETIMSRFWEIEEVPSPSVLNKEDDDCERIFVATYTRQKDGRYTVTLPFKRNPTVLGDSYNLAYRRFLGLEKRLELSRSLRDSYNEVMQGYISQNHVSLISDDTPVSPGYYIPHHAVFKESSSTPLRVVFDASARTDSSFSLNDILYTGPKLQADVVTMLLNFRLFEVAMTADIRQMYRMIAVCPEHRKFQRLLWRFSPHDPLLIYELNTVVFGLNSSPYLALRTIHQLASDEAESYPEASKAVLRDMYMDDYVTSVSKIVDAKILFQQMVGLFKAGGFELVKWSSNSSELLSEVPETSRSADIVQFSSDTLKILGLQWHPPLDILSFQIGSADAGCTKRKILSTIAQIHDVLGVLAPVLVYAKLLMKELWISEVGWDETIPDYILHRWSVFCRELPLLRDFKIPRHLGVFENSPFSLIGFTDASEKAYGAVVYIKTCLNGNASISLVIAKSRVAPVKLTSIPRLELMAVHLLAKLVRYVVDNFRSHGQVNIEDIFALSDSTVALSWINASPHRWKTFVANRVAKIQELLPPSHWYHVRGVENPADIVSRGLTPSQFLENSVWISGPSWLLLDKENWPVQSFRNCNTDLEEKTVSLISLDGKDSDDFYGRLVQRTSSWTKLIGIMSCILKFCRILPASSGTSSVDVDRSEQYLIKLVQRKHFSAEIHLLEHGEECSQNLRKLRPFLKDGIMVVGGRLRNANLSFSQKHPVLLPKNDHLVVLLIDYYHRKNLHTGANLTLALLRQRYWILAARSVVRKRVQTCNLCFRSRPKMQFPLMADLPSFRVQEAKPFAYTGLDYAGPFLINISRTRGAKSQKAYICLFVCLTTKALHLELVSDLSTANFIQALKRFLARRGPCRTLFSDCGTNFIGAKNSLDELYTLVTSEEYMDKFRSEIAFRQIEWKFNPPSAPHFGGIWEANVKSVKSHLYKVVGQQVLSYEEFNTLLVQIESLLNSRPLCVLSSDPADPEALTPAHFLNLTPLEGLFGPDLTDQPVNRLNRYQLIEKMIQDYWRRWHLEYLNTLQARERWNKTSPNILAPGSVVIIKQDNIPPLQWPLGIIEEVFPNKDGVVRVVSVRTKRGVLKRPVVKVCPLPTQ